MKNRLEARYLRNVNAVRVGSANVDAVREVLRVGGIEVVATVVFAADDFKFSRCGGDDSTITVVASVAGGRRVLLSCPNVGGLLVQRGHTTLQVACTSPRHSLAPSGGIAQLQATLKRARPLYATKVAAIVVGAADDFELLLRGGCVADFVKRVLVFASGAIARGLAGEDGCGHERARSQSGCDEEGLERHG